MRCFQLSFLVGFGLALAACEKPAPVPPEPPAPPEAPPAAEAPPPPDVPAVLDAAAPPPGPPSGKRAPCDTDQSCNDDPAVSALWGRCVETVCKCEPGFELMPWGRCKPVK